MNATKTQKGLLGTKLGMTQVWDEQNKLIPVTIIQAGPCVVTQVRTAETDGYAAVQLGYGAIDPRKVTKPLTGHFEKAGVTPRRTLVEIRTADASEYAAGQELGADTFEAGQSVDVTGTTKDKGEIAANLEKVYNYFPRLKTRRTSQAAYTSGGEQQMCAIGRALMANPSVVLLDEPSMGLAPQIVEEVFEIVKDLNQKEKVTFLLAEQNTNMALKYADYGYIMESGRIVMDGAAADLRNNEDVKEFYLGMGGGERKSFKDVKSYKRRKRWLA